MSILFNIVLSFLDLVLILKNVRIFATVALLVSYYKNAKSKKAVFVCFLPVTLHP